MLMLLFPEPVLRRGLDKTYRDEVEGGKGLRILLRFVCIGGVKDIRFIEVVWKASDVLKIVYIAAIVMPEKPWLGFLLW